MNELGTESQGLVQRVGLWDVTETVWDTPDAAPVTTTGQMLRMKQVILLQNADQDAKEQRFIMADGTGTMWLAHRYAYVRRV